MTDCSSFSDALAVPRLAEACIHVLTPAAAKKSDEGAYDPVSGIKILRLVNKGTRQVSQRMIKEFTMQLGSGKEQRPTASQAPKGVVKFLQRVSLRYLSILLTDDFVGKEAMFTN